MPAPIGVLWPAGTVVAMDVVTLTDAEITGLLVELMDEQRRRAAEAGDLDAISEEAHRAMFGAKLRVTPQLVDGLLIVPGVIVEKSATSHDCVHGSIDDAWVWESDLVLHDDLRHVPDGPRRQQRSVTLFAGLEGTAVTMVTSKMRQQHHKMTSAVTFEVRGGELVVTETRAPKSTAGLR